MEESIKIILEAVQRAQGELANTVKEIDKITAATKKQRSAFEQVDGIIQKHRGTLLAVSAAAAAVAASMVLLVKNTIKTGDEFNALSQKTGVSVENLSTLTAVAKNANLEQGELANTFKFLGKSIQEAQVSTSEQAKAFAAMGIKTADANGNLRNSFDVLLDLSDVFAKSADGAGKTALSMQLLGRAGQEAIPLLNQGSAAIKSQQAEVTALGGQMSGDFAKAADGFNDKVNNIGVIVRGAALEITTKILPALTKLADLALENKQIVVVAFEAIAVAVTVASAAFVTFKAASLIAALGQIIQIVGTCTIGFGGMGAAATAAGTAAAATAVSFAIAAGALLALAAAVGIVITAFDAYKASQDEAAANKSLEQSTERIRARLRGHIADLKETGKVTDETAKKLNDTLTEGAKTGDIDGQLSANAAVIAAIRDKVDTENRFAVAARAGTTELDKQAGKAQLPDPKVTEAQLKLANAEAQGQISISQSVVAHRLAQDKAGFDAQEAALKKSVQTQLITAQDFEAQRQALLDQRIAAETQAAQDESELATRALVAKQASVDDPAERAQVSAEIQTIEIDLQAKLNEITADGAKTRLEITDAAVDAEIASRARLLQSKGAVQDSAGGKALAVTDLAQVEAESDLEKRQASAGARALQETEFAALRLEQERSFSEQSLEIEHQKNLLSIEDLKITLAEKNALIEDEELRHQNNLDTTKLGFAAKEIKIEDEKQKTLKTIRNEQLDGTQTTFDLMANAARSFGKQGVIAYKAFASASALIDTYKSAVAAYSSMIGIPYVGPVLAPIAAAAAVAAGLANVAKINSISFAEGGLVPGAPSRRDNRVANVASGEYIFPSNVVSRMGPAWFAGLHDSILRGEFPGFEGMGSAVPRPRMGSSFATGGLVGDDSRPITQQPDFQNISVGFVNTRNAMREFQKQDGIRLVVDQLEQRQNQVFS